MDDLVKKFKKIVHEEKKGTMHDSSLNETQTEPSHQQLSFGASQSHMSHKSTNKHKFNKSGSESNLNLTSLNRSHSQNKENLQFNDTSSISSTTNDSIYKIISSTINYIQKNKDNVSLNKIVDSLNQIQEEHIKNMTNLRIANNKTEQQELILRTQYGIADDMVKNFELRYLKSQKDKGTFKKQLDEMTEKYERLKDKDEMNNQKEERLHFLERNNDALIKTNEGLNKYIEEMKENEEKIRTNFEKEISVIQEMLCTYKDSLAELTQKVYGNKS